MLLLLPPCACPSTLPLPSLSFDASFPLVPKLRFGNALLWGTPFPPLHPRLRSRAAVEGVRGRGASVPWSAHQGNGVPQRQTFPNRSLGTRGGRAKREEEGPIVKGSSRDKERQRSTRHLGTARRAIPTLIRRRWMAGKLVLVGQESARVYLASPVSCDQRCPPCSRFASPLHQHRQPEGVSTGFRAVDDQAAGCQRPGGHGAAQPQVARPAAVGDAPQRSPSTAARVR